MFRTPSLAKTSSASKKLVANWTPKRRTLPAQYRVSSPCCVLSPIHYEPGYAYPLVVWLHSANSSELELRQVLPLVSVRNFVGVAPRGTLRTDKTRRVYGWQQTSGDVADACQRVRDCVEIARNQFNIHADRVFVAGYGEGGTMALRVGMEHPEIFAGAISLGGRVPRGSNAFRRINAARRLPLMLSVSPCEQGYAGSQVMDDLKLLHSGGFSLELRLYPEGDSLTDTMLTDLNKWIMEQFCPSATVVS
jgi:phospholipase/carboxylesterase